MDEFKIKTTCFSSDDYKTQEEDPNQFKRWFGKDYNSNIKYIDHQMFDWISLEGKKRGILTVKKTGFNSLLRYFYQGNLVGMPIDWTTLSDKNGPYLGHFILFTGIDTENNLIYLNDPDIGKDQKYKISQLKKAWEHPAIADDFLVIKGKK